MSTLWWSSAKFKILSFTFKIKNFIFYIQNLIFLNQNFIFHIVNCEIRDKFSTLWHQLIYLVHQQNFMSKTKHLSYQHKKELKRSKKLTKRDLWSFPWLHILQTRHGPPSKLRTCAGETRTNHEESRFKQRFNKNFFDGNILWNDLSQVLSLYSGGEWEEDEEGGYKWKYKYTWKN